MPPKAIARWWSAPGSPKGSPLHHERNSCVYHWWPGGHWRTRSGCQHLGPQSFRLGLSARLEDTCAVAADYCGDPRGDKRTLPPISVQSNIAGDFIKPRAAASCRLSRINDHVHPTPPRCQQLCKPLRNRRRTPSSAYALLGVLQSSILSVVRTGVYHVDPANQ